MRRLEREGRKGRGEGRKRKGENKGMNEQGKKRGNERVREEGMGWKGKGGRE